MTPTALVTGASGGIGSAAAVELGVDHDVLVHYHRDRAGAESVVDDIVANGRNAVAHGCDVSDPDAVLAMVNRARDEFGRVDVLVNNAGVLHTADLETVSPETIRHTLAVNLSGSLYCTAAVLSGMLEREHGRIVTVTSTAGIHGSSTDAVYGASKGGLIGLTKSVAKQYTSRGVHANAVAPGPTDTAMYAEERRPATRDRSPIGRLVDPEEVAEAIRFFATTTAISGEVLAVDGGIHL